MYDAHVIDKQLPTCVLESVPQTVQSEVDGFTCEDVHIRGCSALWWVWEAVTHVRFRINRGQVSAGDVAWAKDDVQLMQVCEAPWLMYRLAVSARTWTGCVHSMLGRCPFTW
jgi:hypothetical protein